MYEYLNNSDAFFLVSVIILKKAQLSGNMQRILNMFRTSLQRLFEIFCTSINRPLYGRIWMAVVFNMGAENACKSSRKFFFRLFDLKN
jgi:hypothetical protein